MFDVDLVLPYVDNTKPIWRQNYIKFCQDNNRLDVLHRIDTERYDDFGLLKYIFRGIDKFMPWLRKIHLIVQDKTQVPDWVNQDKVHVVLHEDFIPQEYLLTYNSCTIEMFLHKIPDLAEHFLYTNDDIYFLNFLTVDDFFNTAGFPMLALKKKIQIMPRCMFDQVSGNCWFDANKATKNNLIDDSYYLMPEHGVNPLLKSHCEECFDKLKYNILNNLSSFRTMFNHNQYLFTDYAYCKKEYGMSKRKFAYSKMTNNIDEIASIISSKKYQYICLNDSSATNRKYFHDNMQIIYSAFEDISLQDKCKYEV